MNKLENPTKSKHDHKWTDKLKVIIFALLMLAPLFSVLVKCLYTLNPNAKESYYGETINEYSIETPTINNINNETKYELKIQNENSNINAQTLNLTMIKIIYVKNQTITDTLIQQQDQIDGIFFFTNSDKQYLTFRHGTTDLTGVIDTTVNLINFEFYYITTTNTALKEYIVEHSTYKVYNQYSYLDNVFYYSVNQIKEDNLFKWVDNTIVYSGLNAMNTGFGLDSNHVLTYLLAYWTILTAIYIVIDIILFLFTKLTHLLQ